MATSSRAYQDSLDRLASFRRGERSAIEPAPPLPAPVPPVGVNGWDIVKTIIRSGDGTIERVEETWRPAAEPA